MDETKDETIPIMGQGYTELRTIGFQSRLGKRMPHSPRMVQGPCGYSAAGWRDAVVQWQRSRDHG